MSGEYISIKNLCPNPSNEIIGVDIFQPQGIINSNKIKTMIVGIMKNPNDVLISDFELPPNFVCYIVSKLYDLEGLILAGNINKMIPMIKIIICGKQNKNVPIVFLCYNFIPDSNIGNNIGNIKEKEINGKFNISFHYVDDGMKYIILETYEKYVDEDKIFVELTEWIVEDIVQNVLKKYY